MKMLLKIIFAISLISLIACDTSCTLSTMAKARVSASTCFAKVQNIICSMSQAEQDLWAEANGNATSPYCFDCSSINKASLKTAIKGHAAQVGDLIGTHNKDDRSKLKCLFQTINNQTSNTSHTEGQDVATSMAKGGVAFGNCSAHFIVDSVNHLIDRRRILCAAESDMDSMIGSTDSSGNALDFAFNTTEAQEIVSKFIDFFTCSSSYASSMQNAAAEAQNIIANDPKCKASARLLQTSSSSSSSQNPQMAPGSRALNASVYVADIKSIATAKATAAYTNLATKVTASFNSTTPINCMEGGLPKFLSGINQASDLVQYLGKSVDCSNDFLLVITNGQATCEGTCASGFPITITTKSSAINFPTDYYFASGCASSARFVYGEFTNPSDSLVYTFLAYHKDNDNFNSNSICGARNQQCRPPKNDTASIPSDCPEAQMNSACKNSMIRNCQASGYSSDSSLNQFTLPSACDYVSQGVSVTDSTFVQNCLEFIVGNFINHLELNSNNVQDVASILNDNQSSSTGRRLSSGSVSIVNSDPTKEDTSYFSSVMLSNSDISVDSSLSAASSQLSTSPGSYITVSFVVLMVIALLF